MRHINRRSLLEYSLFGAGAAAMGGPISANAAGWDPYANRGPDKLVIDDTSAVADTESGKVVGYLRDDIRVFQGIPYGEILSPEGRWQRGAKARPWTGIRSSRAQGPICPPDDGPAGPASDENLLRNADAQPFIASEDCLRVNVWTPGIDNKKRQVLFWCHGGGFRNGSPLMTLRYEPHNLAKYGDVVVVNFTHRLNALGYLDLSAYGARYADSANVGLLDMVDALKWVKANIANFGGDPDKVMIFGQSGGGAKVAALLVMPEAKGLFNRAIIESPGPLPFSTPEQGAALAASFLKMVDVAPANIEALHKLPLATLMHAAGTISATFNDARERAALASAANGWRPVVDGRAVAYQPTLRAVSDVPVMIGSNLHEGYTALGHPEYMTMGEAPAREIVRETFGAVSDGVYDVYRGAFPKATPYEISSMARATSHFRGAVVNICQRRVAQNAAPTYNYWFQWRANTFGGRAMSHHELEIPLIFLNSDAVPTLTGGTAEARALSLKMADCWLAFARTGNPNTAGLPEWKPVTRTAMNSMVFDNVCRIDQGSDLAAIEMFWRKRFPNA